MLTMISSPRWTIFPSSVGQDDELQRGAARSCQTQEKSGPYRTGSIFIGARSQTAPIFKIAGRA